MSVMSARFSLCAVPCFAKCHTLVSAILAMRPVRHRPQGPCSQGALHMKAVAFNTVIACLRTMICCSLQYTRSPQIVGRET